MSFRIEITEIFNPVDGGGPTLDVKRYEQTVDALDLKAVMTAVNKVPRKPRERKQKAADKAA